MRWRASSGAILALPVAAAFRDVVRYLFRRLSPDGAEAVMPLVRQVGMDPGGGLTRRRCGWPAVGGPSTVGGADPARG